MNDQEFYDGLHQKLSDTIEFPDFYLFKFIIPDQAEQVAAMERLFEPTSHITRRNSKNGKYISLTAKHWVTSADEIIGIYKTASKIEGIISL